MPSSLWVPKVVNLGGAVPYPPVYLGAGECSSHPAEESRGPDKFGDAQTRGGAGGCFFHPSYDGIQYRFQVEAETERKSGFNGNGGLPGLGGGFVGCVETVFANAGPRRASYLFHYC